MIVIDQIRRREAQVVTCQPASGNYRDSRAIRSDGSPLPPPPVVDFPCDATLGGHPRRAHTETHTGGRQSTPHTTESEHARGMKRLKLGATFDVQLTDLAHLDGLVTHLADIGSSIRRAPSPSCGNSPGE